MSVHWKTIIIFLCILVILAGILMRFGGGKRSPKTSPSLYFNYPPTLSTTYVGAVDWPPKLAQIDSPFTCTQAGSETARTGKTAQQMINGRNYCITTLVEGAAGSIYKQYAYATSLDDRHIIILTFSLRYPQCLNYDEPKRSACQREEQGFNIDSLIASGVVQ